MFRNKVVVITGGAQGIGAQIARDFAKEGAHICIIDKRDNEYFKGDIKDKSTLESFSKKVINDYGRVDYLINNALPPTYGISNCTYEEFSEALAVGVTAPFYLTQLFLPYFEKDAVIINISSTRATMSQPETESYTAAKGGISALTHALAISLSGKVRVNSISPGWIDTVGEDHSKSDKLQYPIQRVGKSEDISNMVMYLCSDKASFITGENIIIDGGMTRQMIYHGDKGWKKS